MPFHVLISILKFCYISNILATLFSFLLGITWSLTTVFLDGKKKEKRKKVCKGWKCIGKNQRGCVIKITLMRKSVKRAEPYCLLLFLVVCPLFLSFFAWFTPCVVAMVRCEGNIYSFWRFFPYCGSLIPDECLWLISVFINNDVGVQE